jgi:hypothetical protein
LIDNKSSEDKKVYQKYYQIEKLNIIRGMARYLPSIMRD